jgi:hypothetical protein
MEYAVRVQGLHDSGHFQETFLIIYYINLLATAIGPIPGGSVT